MIIAVYIDDQSLFDNLWKYEQLHWTGNGLMNWEINPQGTAASGTGAATDGDEDMAFALVMADRQLGRPRIARRHVPQHRARSRSISSGRSRSTTAGATCCAPGDQFGGDPIVNISYFAPGLLPDLRPGHRQDRRLGQGRVDQLRRPAGDAERRQRQREQRPGPRLVDAGRRADGAAGQSRPTTSSTRAARRSASRRTTAGSARARALTYLEKISGFYAGSAPPNSSTATR